MSSQELTARINKFIDRKLPVLTDVSDLSDHKARRTHRQHAEVSTTPTGYIALAIK